MAPTVVVDRRHDVGVVVLICASVGLLSTLNSKDELGDTGFWLSLGYGLALVAASVGIWRASEWARWVGGLASVTASLRLLISILPVLSRSTSESASAKSVAYAMALGIAAFWAAIAFYLLRPSTGKLFAHLRAARARSANTPG